MQRHMPGLNDAIISVFSAVEPTDHDQLDLNSNVIRHLATHLVTAFMFKRRTAREVECSRRPVGWGGMGMDTGGEDRSTTWRKRLRIAKAGVVVFTPAVSYTTAQKPRLSPATADWQNRPLSASCCHAALGRWSSVEPLTNAGLP